MILGALVDAGLPIDSLTNGLSKLNISGYRISASKSQRAGLKGTKVDVLLEDEDTGPHHRRLQDILSTICNSKLSPRVKERSDRVFRNLAKAEARVHDTTLEDVRLHEVGATDALVDIIGCNIGLELLGIDDIYCSPIPGGSGTTYSLHGDIPVPAPATLELLAMAGAPIRVTSAAGPEMELSTPTGVALVTSLASFQQPVLRLERIGYGLGQRDPKGYPNALAMWVGEVPGSLTVSPLLLMETNIDDMSPELYGYVMERLLEAGAKDVWFTPIQMKKNRPAVMLSLLGDPQDEAGLANILLRETSTLGVRVRPIERFEADREVKEFTSSLGSVQVKVKILDGKTVGVSPEYESCRKLALDKRLPLREVYRIVTYEAGQQMMGDT